MPVDERQTVPMKRARTKDWLLGASGMMLVLMVAVAMLWWLVTDPADGDVARPGSSSAAGVERPPGREPPADLREDEAWFAELRLDAETVVTAGSRLRDVSAVGHDVVTRPDAVVAAQVSMKVTVPFEVVADELGDGTEVRAADGGQATIVRTV